MNARQLEVFRAVMQTGSTVDAARLLNVSQPTISKILLHMESQLGLPLFRRIRGRLQPTPEAELLFPEADRVFRDLSALRALSDDLRRGSSGLVRIACSSSLAATLVPQVVAGFGRRFPKVKTETHMVPAREVAEMVRAHDVDLGLVLSPRDVHTLEVTTLGTVDMVCALPEGHRLAAAAVVTPRALEGEPLVSYPAQTHFGAMLDAAFREDGASRRTAIETSGALMALAHVAAGSGVAVVDRLAVRTCPPGLVWRPFRPRVRLPVNMLTSQTLPASLMGERLREALQRSVAALIAATVADDGSAAL
ncbi:LysR substrate-binding domain-containing protein [Pseudoxanthobacter sp.]|uniref:LysR substrate-binding domain-containing protein n=1 Tax=Pseudoxanthobacter sp. TaxID=1925742 RepID=UPI002FE2C1F2